MTTVIMTGRPFAYPKERIRILLLEGTHANAVSEYRRCGYTAVEQLPGTPDEDRRMTSLQEMLGTSHVLTLHMPDLPSTRGMIGAGELAAIPPGSYLVNASRGRVVDIKALASAPHEQLLAGAAADVFPHEPKSAADPFGSPLRGLPNTILTQRIAASTTEAWRGGGSMPPV